MATGPKYYTEDLGKFPNKGFRLVLALGHPEYFERAKAAGYYDPSITAGGLNNYDKIIEAYNKSKQTKQGMAPGTTAYYDATRAEFEYLKALAAFEDDPSFENFYSGRALGQAKREGQMGTTALDVHPVRFNAIEPRALAGQIAGHDAHSLTCPPHPLVVRPQPIAHLLADMPRGIVPDHEQRLLAGLGQL